MCCYPVMLSCDAKDSRLVIQNTADASHITDRAVSILIHHFNIIIIINFDSCLYMYISEA